MPFSTPFRSLFFMHNRSVLRFFFKSSTEVGSSQSFRVHDPLHRSDVFHHGLRDGGEVISFEFDNEVMIAKQHGCIRDMGEGFDLTMDLLFGSWLNIDEYVSNGHVAHAVTRVRYSSPFRCLGVFSKGGF